MSRVRAAVRVELAEPEPDRQDVPDRGVHVGLGEQALVQRGLERRATVGAVLLSSTVKLSSPALSRRRTPRPSVVVVVLSLRSVVRRPGVADVEQRPGRSTSGRTSFRSAVDVVGRPLTRLYEAITPVAASAAIARPERAPRRTRAAPAAAGWTRWAAVGLVVVGEVVLEHRRGLQVDAGGRPASPLPYAVEIAPVSSGSSE